MSDAKVSGLTSAATLTGAERFPVTQSNQSKAATAAQLLSSSLFTQTGTGAIARSINSKFGDIVSVKDFGAVGDGVTDDTAAFAAVRAYAATLTPPPEIQIPQGTYLITASPSWPLNFLSIRGIGLPEIHCTGSGSVFDMDASASGSVIYGMNVENLKLRGNASAAAAITQAKVSHSTFKNIHAREIATIAFDLGWAVGCTYTKLVCSINEQAMTTVPARGIKLRSSGGNNSTANVFIDTIMEGMLIGIDCNAADFNTFKGGTSEACTAHGVVVNTGSKYNSFQGMGFEANTTTDILDQGTGTTVEDCYGSLLFNMVGATMPHYKNVLAQSVTIDNTTVGASMENIRISNFAAGGVFTDNAAGTYKKNIYNVNTAAFILQGMTSPGIHSSVDKIYPGTDAAAVQAVAGIYAGNGVPNNANGSNGDFYFRGDGTQAGNTVIYHKQAGAWVALITT